MNRRRKLLAALGAGLFAVPALAQVLRRPARVGLLAAGGTTTRYVFEAVKGRLRELGYVEFRNVEYLYVSADGYTERLEPLARELVASKVDVIVAGPPSSVLAAYKATRTIPIVMGNVPDPVGLGVVSSLARPGGNVTGVSSQTEALVQKKIELVREVFPQARRIGILLNESSPNAPAYWSNAEKAGASLRLALVKAVANKPEQIEQAIGSLARERVQAIVVPADALFLLHRRPLNELIGILRLPGVFTNREHVVDGGLISYAPHILENYRLAAEYVDKILKGAKPAELPVQQSNRIELMVNLKTAKALGITIPQSVLLRADEVIQ